MEASPLQPVFVAAWIDPELREWVDQLAAERGVTRSQEIRRALLNHVRDGILQAPSLTAVTS